MVDIVRNDEFLLNLKLLNFYFLFLLFRRSLTLFLLCSWRIGWSSADLPRRQLTQPRQASRQHGPDPRSGESSLQGNHNPEIGIRNPVTRDTEPADPGVRNGNDEILSLDPTTPHVLDGRVDDVLVIVTLILSPVRGVGRSGHLECTPR